MVKVYKVQPKLIKHDQKPGLITASKNDVKVTASNGYIYLKEIQLPGKRKMDIKSLLNGYHFDKKAKMF